MILIRYRHQFHQPCQHYQLCCLHCRQRLWWQVARLFHRLQNHHMLHRSHQIGYHPCHQFSIRWHLWHSWANSYLIYFLKNNNILFVTKSFVINFKKKCHQIRGKNNGSILTESKSIRLIVILILLYTKYIIIYNNFHKTDWSFSKQFRFS